MKISNKVKVIIAKVAKVFLKVFLLIASIGLLVGSYLLLNHITDYSCFDHPPTWSDFENGLNSDYVFKTPEHRRMAESIYSYRIKHDGFKKSSSEYAVIFTSIVPDSNYLAEQLSDVALHKLTTCDRVAFNKLMVYVDFFNNPAYAFCISAYDESSKRFKGDARKIIINEIFKVNPAPLSPEKGPPTKVGIVQEQIPKYSDEDLYKLLTNGLF